MSKREEKKEESRSRKNVRVEQQVIFSRLTVDYVGKNIQVNIFRTHLRRKAKDSFVYL